MQTRLSRTPILPILAAALCMACGGAAPRFSPDVSAALAEQPMRRLETERLMLYYPAARRDQALRVAERLEGCADALHRQTRIRNEYSRTKMIVIMPELPFNNAYVLGQSGGNEHHTLIPTFNTFDFSSELGLPSDPSYVGCHEIVHYVQFLQVSGFWRTVNTLFGDLFPPQAGFDPWFIEGLATYYESRLQPGTGRMAWPVWRGMFHAGVAGRRLDGGDLSVFQRDAHWGNHYLVGSFFIEFLATRYGEDKLWELVAVQGRSIFSPLWLSLRFQHVYGKSLSALIDELADWTAEHYPVRPRPADQRRLRTIGINARYARAPDGTEAVIANDHDAPPRLSLYRADGSLLRDHNLVEVVPPRKLITGAPALVSGLSFTADGRTLFFTVVDEGATFQVARLVAYDLASGAMRIVRPDLGGTGGAIAGDGRTYYFARADGDRMDLAALDLGTGQVRVLAQAPPRTYFMAPRPSPDGTRLVASVFSPERGYAVRVLDAGSGAVLDEVPLAGRQGYDASFIDDHRLVLLAPHEGRFQVFAYDLRTRALARLSDAPYLAFAPQAQGGTVRFLNREGWRWTLDEVPLQLPAGTGAERPDREDASAADAGGAEDAAGAGGAADAGGADHADGQAPPLAANAPGAARTGATAASLPPPASASPRVLSDTPYSQLDHLFVPQIHGFAILGAENATRPLLGMTLSGHDRLGFHSWGLLALLQPGANLWSGSLGYINTQLAPLTVSLSATQLSWESSRNQDMSEVIERRHQRIAALSVARTIRSSTDLALGALGIEDERPDDPVPLFQRRRMAGPFLSMRYAGAEGTPYGGLRRALLLSARAAFYPAELGSLDESFVDLRGALGVSLPLPLSRRHSLNATLRGRALAGLSAGSNLIEVGGVTALDSLYRHSSGPEGPGYSAERLPPGLRFIEPLRGFEDFAFGADRIAIADATYRYPIIIDRGFASVLWLLPSLFFQQLDFELFGAAALAGLSDLDQDLHAAAGAALSANLRIWLVPLTLRYQLARRLTDDRVLVHDIGLGIGL